MIIILRCMIDVLVPTYTALNGDQGDWKGDEHSIGMSSLLAGLMLNGHSAR